MGSIVLEPVNQRTAQLNDGNDIPVIGLGMFLSPPHEVTGAVVNGWMSGYRHFDCAQYYRNEAEVGEALQILSAAPGFYRENIWITSKAWNSHHRPVNLQKALDQTLKDLNTSYVDLYLIHWPSIFSAIPNPTSKTGVALELTNGNGDMLLDRELSLVDTWKGMIELQRQGKTRSIGVSNFTPNQIQMLIDATGVVPAVNQVEAHPLLNQQALLDYCNRRGIHISACMPFGGHIARGANQVLENPVVQKVAKKTGKQPSQVIVSWSVKRGFSVLPEAVKADRIEANFRAFDMDDEDYEEITKLGAEITKLSANI